MIDPVTALATASAAFNVIKKGFEVGRDVESMAGDIGRWMGAVSDIKKSDEFAKKPPLFKKMVAKIKTAPATYKPPDDHRLMDDLLDSTTARLKATRTKARSSTAKAA